MKWANPDTLAGSTPMFFNKKILNKKWVSRSRNFLSFFRRLPSFVLIFSSVFLRFCWFGPRFPWPNLRNSRPWPKFRCFLLKNSGVYAVWRVTQSFNQISSIPQTYLWELRILSHSRTFSWDYLCRESCENLSTYNPLFFQTIACVKKYV